MTIFIQSRNDFLMFDFEIFFIHLYIFIFFLSFVFTFISLSEIVFYMNINSTLNAIKYEFQ